MPTTAQYSTQSTRDVASFLDSIQTQVSDGADGAAILDSVKNSPGVTMPEKLGELVGRVGSSADEARVLDSIRLGMEHFKAEHGVLPTADVVEAAIAQGNTAYWGINQQGKVLDSASSAHHDQMSLQPNRAVVAILSSIAEAIPFASYLPVDIASNQAKLAILSHTAGSNYGDFAANALLDGVNAGDVYTSSSRFVRFTDTAVPYTSKFTTRNLGGDDVGFCDPAGTGFPVLRGRTTIYVNGKVAAREATGAGNSANSPISGSVTIGGVSHAISGSVTIATGTVTLTAVEPAFPANTEVTAQAFVDYEEMPALIPQVVVRADMFDLYANPWRVMTSMSVDSSGQMQRELGLDGNSEALMAIRTQMALERHYAALRMAFALGKNNQVEYDFAFTSRYQQMNRAQIWQDFEAALANADQQMANDTMDHGITHLYVPAFIAAQLRSLGSNMFVSSGVAARPSIYRVGRLFGKYEVYYSPKVVSQSADLSTATILAVGRSSQVARCPVVLGDAVAPTFLPLNMQQDLKNSAAMYARDFTVVNPHEPSALGCARITVRNLV